MNKISAPCLIFLLAGLASNAIWARGGGGGHGGSFGGGGHFGGHGAFGGGHFRGGNFGGHHGGWGHGGYYGGIGLGLYGLGYGSGFYGGYSGYPRYGGYYGYPPTVVTVPTTPPVYIQQLPPVAQQYPSGYWYYCRKPEGYYPYIKECLIAWQQVEPRPSVPH